MEKKSIIDCCCGNSKIEISSLEGINIKCVSCKKSVTGVTEEETKIMWYGAIRELARAFIFGFNYKYKK
jgi:hypothetical protein